MKTLRCSYFFCFAAALVFQSGCSSGKPSPTEHPQTQLVVTDNGQTLIHDFGIIRPRSEQSHVFTLKNPTDTDWKISEIVENCSCTVTKVSTDIVPAGGSLEIDLTYRSGTDFTNDQRDTVVHFEQEDVLPITLRVKAKIRPQIVLEPANFSVSSYEPGKNIQNTVVLHDWSGAGLRTVEFRSDDSWISLSVPRTDNTVETSAPFPPWVGRVNIDPKGLPSGKHSGRIEVIATEKGLEYATYMSVTLDVTSPIRIIPSNLFFGAVEPNKTATMNCTILLTVSDAEKDHWESMQVVTDFPANVLKAEITQETKNRGTMAVSLTPQTFDPLRGNVTIKFGEGRYHELSLPVIASVRSETINP